MTLVANDATFEGDVGHWYTNPYSFLLRDTYSVTPHAGSAVLRMVVQSTGTYTGPFLGNGNSLDFYYVNAGDAVNVSAWTQLDPRNQLSAYTVILTLNAYDSGGQIASWDSVSIPVTTSGWAQSTVSGTMPAGAEFVMVQFGFYGPTGSLDAGDVFYISDVSANLRHMVQPANDDFLNAVVISGDMGSITGTTLGATYQFIPYDEHQSFPEEWPADVWYEYTNDKRGQVDFDLVAAGFSSHRLVVYRQEPRGGPADITMLLNTAQDGTSSTADVWSTAFFYNPEWRYFIRIGASSFPSSTSIGSFTLTWHLNPLDGTVVRGTSSFDKQTGRVHLATQVSRIAPTTAGTFTSVARDSGGGAGLGWIGAAPGTSTTGQAFRCQEWVESLGTGFRHFWVGWTPSTGSFFYSYISEGGFFPNWNNENEFTSGNGGFFASTSTSALNGSLVAVYTISKRMNQTPLSRFIWSYGDMEHGGSWNWDAGTTGVTIGISSAQSHSSTHSLEVVVNTTLPSGTSVVARADGSTAVYVDKNKQYMLRSWTSGYPFSVNTTLGTTLESIPSPSGGLGGSSGSITSSPTSSFDYNYNYATVQTDAWNRYLRPDIYVSPDNYTPRPLTAGDHYYWDDIEISEFLYSTVAQYRLTTQANDTFRTISDLSDEAHLNFGSYHVDITSSSTTVKHLVAIDTNNQGDPAGRFWFYTFDADWNLVNRRMVDADYDGAPIILDNDGSSVVFVKSGVNLCKYDVEGDSFSTVIASGAPGAVVGVASNGDYVFNSPSGSTVEFLREPRGGGGYYYASGEFNKNTQMTTPSHIIQRFDLGIDYTGDYEWFAAYGSTSVDSVGGNYNFVTCFYRRSIDSFDTSPMTPTFTLDHPYVDGTDPSADGLPSHDIRYVIPTGACPALFEPGSGLTVGVGGDSARGVSSLKGQGARVYKYRR